MNVIIGLIYKFAEKSVADGCLALLSAGGDGNPCWASDEECACFLIWPKEIIYDKSYGFDKCKLSPEGSTTAVADWETCYKASKKDEDKDGDKDESDKDYGLFKIEITLGAE